VPKRNDAGKSLLRTAAVAHGRSSSHRSEAPASKSRHALALGQLSAAMPACFPSLVYLASLATTLAEVGDHRKGGFAGLRKFRVRPFSCDVISSPRWFPHPLCFRCWIYIARLRWSWLGLSEGRGRGARSNRARALQACCHVYLPCWVHGKRLEKIDVIRPAHR